jgi:hypothetical protein
VATDAISLCSQALVLLGAGAIASFEDGPAAATATQLYPGVRDTLLAKHPWKFATTTVQLARSATVPDRWPYAFALPGEVLVLRGLYPDDADGSAPVTDYERRGLDVLTRQDPLWAEYTYAAAEAVWPAYFATLMRYALAAELAIPVTDNGTPALTRYQRVIVTVCLYVLTAFCTIVTVQMVVAVMHSMTEDSIRVKRTVKQA